MNEDALCLSAGDVINVRCAVEGVVARHVTGGKNQSSVFAATVAKADDRLLAEEPRQRTCQAAVSDVALVDSDVAPTACLTDCQRIAHQPTDQLLMTLLPFAKAVFEKTWAATQKT